MIVYTRGEYTVRYIGKAPTSGAIIINGIEVSTNGARGYNFALYKKDILTKSYTTTGATSEPVADTIKSVVTIFKKYMV